MWSKRLTEGARGPVSGRGAKAGDGLSRCESPLGVIRALVWPQADQTSPTHIISADLNLVA